MLSAARSASWPTGPGNHQGFKDSNYNNKRELYSAFRDSECLTTLTEAKHWTHQKLHKEKEKSKWHNTTINILILTNKTVNGIIIQQTYSYKSVKKHTSLDQIHAHIYIQFHTYMHARTHTLTKIKHITQNCPKCLKTFFNLSTHIHTMHSFYF